MTRPGGALAALGARPWLALDGGGIKGLAHVGAWRRLQEEGARFAGAAGCSIGAVVAACIASGMDPADMHDAACRLRRQDILRIRRRAAWVNGIRTPSVFRGRTLREHIAKLVPVQGWDELRMPLQVNAVNLATGRTEWFGPGGRTDISLADALYASAALPVLFPPLEAGGSFFVDGGLDQVLPVERAREAGATGVLAVSVGGPGTVDAHAVAERGMIAVHERALAIATHHRRNELRRRALAGPVPAVLVEPRLEEYGGFDFRAIPRFLEAGFQAAGEALAQAASGARATAGG